MELITIEQELLRNAAKGNEVSFVQLFRIYKHKLYSFLVRATGSPEMTEDIIQDIFLKLWNDRASLTNIEQFGGYIYRMAQHRVINAFKRMARETLILSELQQEQPSVNAMAEDNLTLREVWERLQSALEELPPRQKLVYTLSRDQGLKHEEIARYLNISPSTVNNHMIAALRTIRKQLSAHLTTTTVCAALAVILFFQK